MMAWHRAKAMPPEIWQTLREWIPASAGITTGMGPARLRGKLCPRSP